MRPRSRLKLAAAVLFGLLLAGDGRAVPLVADLSDYLVAITTGFTGTNVLLFGAIDEPGDVVVVIRGSDRPVVMHRKSRIAGIWVNTATMTFEDVPSFYSIASSRPLEEIASDSVRARNEFGVEFLKIELPSAKASPNVAKAWEEALIRNKQRSNLFPVEVGRVDFLGNQLFRTDVFFPANVPTGTYQAQTFLLRDGQVISAQVTPLIVSKIGLEAEIFNFAQEQSALYGLIAILVALMAGWLAHIAFRKH